MGGHINENSYEKKIISVMLIASVFSSSVLIIPACAATTNEFQGINNEIKKIYNSFEDLGFETVQLLDVLKMEPKSTAFWGDVPTSYTLSDSQERVLSNRNVDWITEDTLDNYLLDAEVAIEDLPSGEPMARDGDYYDGNPPYSVAEQEDRMNYLWGVYDKYYSASKYAPNPYLIYLYISHYTENINYDRTAPTPNFDSVYAHIICKSDIAAFNNFIKTSQFASAATTIANIGQAYQFIKSVEDGVKIYTRELTSAEEQFSAGVGIVQSLASIELEKNPDFQISEVTKAFTDQYESAIDAESLINNMNTQLQNSGGLDNLVNEYVNTVQGIMVNSTFLSVGPGIIDGIFGAAEMMDTAVSIGNLAQLYVSCSSRRAERMGIYYGLEPWP